MQPIWDLPTRLFHWSLAALLGFSWWSAETERLDWHLWSGLAVMSLIVFRLLWGFFGGSTARFASFVRGPRAILAYLRDRKSWRAIGHSPLGALSVLALLGAVAVQVGLGLFASDEDGFSEGPLAHLVGPGLGERLTGLHEDWFRVVQLLVALHVAAILVYRLKGRKLTGAMISGKGEAAAGAAPLKRARWWVALLCLAAAIGFTRWIIAGAPPFGG